jgi:3-oxoacyl-[acyl-carrier-protein] synthase-3
VKWGSRVTPLGTSDAALPPCERSALEMVNAIRANQDPHGRSLQGLMTPVFAESRPVQ